MMVFLRHNLAFLSIPKTGTHAYQALLGDRADVIFRHPQHLKHMGLRRFENRVVPLLDLQKPIEIFGIIREPVDWLGSWFRYRARPEIRHRPASTLGRTFDAFVEAYLSDKPPPFAQVGSQADLIAPEGHAGRVQHLYKYDHPEAIADFLENRLNTSLRDLPVVNTSPKAELALDPGLRQQLERKRAREFQLYALARDE